MEEKSLEDLLLATLSFYEDMSFEKLILDFDSEVIKNSPQLTREEVENALKRLVQKKLVKEIEDASGKSWIKLFPKKSLFEKMKRYFKK